MHPKDGNGIAKSIDCDQTAHSGDLGLHFCSDLYFTVYCYNKAIGQVGLSKFSGRNDRS